MKLSHNIIAQTYAYFRLNHGVLDSIRFTARDLGMKPIDVARQLGLVDYFLEHRST
jgi:hypothetical protein